MVFRLPARYVAVAYCKAVSPRTLREFEAFVCAQNADKVVRVRAACSNVAYRHALLIAAETSPMFRWQLCKVRGRHRRWRGKRVAQGWGNRALDAIGPNACSNACMAAVADAVYGYSRLFGRLDNNCNYHGPFGWARAMYGRARFRPHAFPIP